jgi:hypothetical protein
MTLHEVDLDIFEIQEQAKKSRWKATSNEKCKCPNMSTPIFWVGPWKIFHKNCPSCRLQGDVQPVTQSTKVEVTAETKAGVEEATRRRRYDMTEVGAEYEYIYIYAYGLTWIGIPMK